MQAPTYKHEMSQAYHLLLNSKDSTSFVNGTFEFPLQWSRPLTKDQTYHILVQSFDVVEFGVPSEAFASTVYTIGICEPFNNVYSSSAGGSSSELVVATGKSFKVSNTSVGGVMQNPQFLCGTPLQIKFSNIVDGSCPLPISSQFNTWVISLLIMPVNL